MDDYYKVTLSDGSACHGGTGKWRLPEGGRPGKWMPPVDVLPCQSGYHVCRADQIVQWLGGEPHIVWAVEVRGAVVDDGDKVVVSEARLIHPVLSGVGLLLLASDFAAHVAHLNTDPRVWAAIKATRDYAHGRIDAAARDAAWAAAWDAAMDATWDAPWSAARAAAMDAAGAVAWAAAWDAAMDAAMDAAGDAEREWQTRHLHAVLTGARKPGTVRRRKATTKTTSQEVR